MKIYYIHGLDCASCAMKLENKLKELPLLQNVTLNFTAGELLIETVEPTCDPFEAICAVVAELEPDVMVSEQKPISAPHPNSHPHHPVKRFRLSLPIITLVLGAVLLLPALLLQGTSISVIGFFLSGLLAGWQIFWKGLKKLRRLCIDENILLLISFAAAFAIAEYFEACMVVLLFSFGEALENLAVSRSKRSIEALTKIRPEVATVLRNGKQEQLPCEQISIGDILLIKPGERTGLDCEIIAGESQIDNSAITGEAIPVTVAPGDLLLSGSINLSHALTASVIHRFVDSTASRMIDMVKNAAAQKSNTENFISRFAGIYTPIVILAAILLALIPPLLGFGSFEHWLYTALIFLVASCPCALVISVPLGFFACIGAESKLGVLIKGSKYIEALAKLDTIAFDKTGTLTSGKLTISASDSYQPDYSSKQLLALAAACEQYSTHPIAASILATVTAQQLPTPTDYHEIRGLGISATIDGSSYLCGNKRLLAAYGFDTAALPPANIYLADYDNQRILGGITVSDTLRTESAEILQELAALGAKRATILSGDNEEAVRSTAQALGMDYRAALLPEAKLAALETLKQTARNTAFVGDGINDAPVLAAADIGIAMGLGSDSAIEAADAVLVSDNLTALPKAIRLAKKCMRILYFNVALALITKLLVFLLALFGMGEMWMAVLADVGVSILAVLNATRLLQKK